MRVSLHTYLSNVLRRRLNSEVSRPGSEKMQGKTPKYTLQVIPVSSDSSEDIIESVPYDNGFRYNEPGLNYNGEPL